MTSVVDAPGQVTVVGLEAMLETRFPEIRVPDSWSWWDAPLRDKRPQSATQTRSPSGGVDHISDGGA